MHSSTKSGSSFRSLPESLNGGQLKALVKRFASGIPARLECISTALKLNRWQDVKLLSHRLKGAAAAYGFKVIAEAAADMELAALNSDSERCERLLAELSKLVGEISLTE